FLVGRLAPYRGGFNAFAGQRPFDENYFTVAMGDAASLEIQRLDFQYFQGHDGGEISGMQPEFYPESHLPTGRRELQAPAVSAATWRSERCARACSRCSRRSLRASMRF